MAAEIQNQPSSVNKNIPIEILMDYAAQGLSQPKIAKLVGCSVVNVYNRFKAVNYDPPALKSFKRNRADILSHKQQQILDALSVDEIKKMQPRDKVVSFGILFDKERLERGQSTSNHAVLYLGARATSEGLIDV